MTKLVHLRIFLEEFVVEIEHLFSQLAQFVFSG